jgi:hypothetical protein
VTSPDVRARLSFIWFSVLSHRAVHGSFFVLHLSFSSPKFAASTDRQFKKRLL